jgi:hypothetical protein
MTFWDGERWLPTPSGSARRPPRRTSNSTAIALMVGMSALLVAGSARGSIASLKFDPQSATPGTTVRVTATGLPPQTAVQLEWDAKAAGMPKTRTSKWGVLSTRFEVPPAAAGSHQVTAEALPSRSKTAAVDAGALLATAVFVVSSTTSTPSPTLAPTPSPVVTPTPATPTPSPTPNGEDPTWRTVVNDQFNSGGVPTHWGLYDGPYGSGPRNCATPSHVSVSNGAMRMLMKYESSGLCGPGWYTAGMYLSNADSIDQRITVRFRVVSNGVRSHRIIPMRWPLSNAWPPVDGEEDYCEGSPVTGCMTYLHYGLSNSQVAHEYFVDLTQWHTLRFERRNFVVKAYIDDLANPVWTYNGSSTTLPPTIKHVVLQQECQPAGCPSGTAGTEEIQIDWIAVDVPRI